MTLTIDQAREIALSRLNRGKADDGDDCTVILNEHTLEREWCWVFFHQSRRFVETGDFKYARLGNAPLVVRKSDGEIFTTGTAYPIEKYLDDLEGSGM